MQTTILIILLAATYVFLLIQYKKATEKGSKGLLEALNASRSLHDLNNRTVSTAPLMLLSLACCMLVPGSTMLRPDFASWQWFEILFLSGLCFLISGATAFAVSGPIPSRVRRKEQVRYFSIRIPGLILYELFFRGVVLGVTMQFFSAGFSIALNILLYAVAHVSSLRKEFFGSILFGFALCYTAIRNQSVYPCVLMHLSIALPHEIILLNRYQRTIKNTIL